MQSPFDFVCLSHLRWRSVRHRPHHLLVRFARERRVFYLEEPVLGADDARLEVFQEQEQLWVGTPFLPWGLSQEDVDELQRKLIEELFSEHGIEDHVLWYYTPMAVAFTRDLQPLATVYDCMHELSSFVGAPTVLKEREGELLDSADLIFTAGYSLFEDKRRRHPHVHLFPNGVEPEHFRRARRRLPEPEDQGSVAHPRLGFFGVIDERVDLDLLAGVADARPAWQVVMLGPVSKIDPETLPRRDNIHWLGQKPYAELPAYASGWDVALMPFARNDSTRYISPAKTVEYLAAGLPVVSTSVPDVVRPYGDAGLVRVADDVGEYVSAIEAAMLDDGASRLEKVDEMLPDLSWDATWERMSDLVEDEVTAREAARVAPIRVGPPDPTEVAARGLLGRDDEGPWDSRHVFDYLVVGAGFAGAVLAERLASQAGKRVLVVERRNHVAGNAYDHFDDEGVLIHRYGPHIFHTNSLDVFEYLSEFTEWRPYEHRVLASVDGQLLPIPINLDTVNRLYGLSLSSMELEDFFESVAEPVEHLLTSEDMVVSKVGRQLYEKFFRGYTQKQWGLDPSELDASVTARVPVRTNRDDRYFTDKYQAMPVRGYTRMFEKMLSHPNIKLMLNTDYREIMQLLPYREVIYTGPIDEFFDFRYGKLPYRSLHFEFETADREVFQPAPVINYPNDYPYTRVTEFKYLTGQKHPKTTVVYEYPRGEGDPYYPVPRPENAEVYKRYKALGDSTPGVRFVGRLATYKYYNMDQVAAQALAVFERIAGRRRVVVSGSERERRDVVTRAWTSEGNGGAAAGGTRSVLRVREAWGSS